MIVPNNSSESDEALMAKYLAGSDQAFEIVYDRRREGVRRFLERQCGSPGVGQELAQDVWFRVIRACGNGNYAAEAKFTTYLYRVAKNILIDWYRRNGNMKTVSLYRSGDDPEEGEPIDLLDPATSDMEAVLADKETVRFVIQAIDTLPELQKATLLMFIEGGLSLEEIADAMDTSRETAKTRLRYARKALREQVFE